MFRIRRVYEDNLRNEPQLIPSIGALLQSSFTYIDEAELAAIVAVVERPYSRGFNHFLYIAEHTSQGVIGAILCCQHFAHNFFYIDYLAAEQSGRRGGVGGALYQRVRELASSLKSKGIFLEVEPEATQFAESVVEAKQNRARIRFYERFGAYLVLDTAFESERTDGTHWSLMYDPLGRKATLSKSLARQAVEVIMSVKNGATCPRSLRQRVLTSIVKDPVSLRVPKTSVTPQSDSIASSPPRGDAIFLADTGIQEQHHVRDKGYYEAPIRVRELRRGLERLRIFDRGAIRYFPEKHILAVHDRAFYSYLKRMAQQMEPGRFVYAEVFPLRSGLRPPTDLISRAGYYATDSFTPISRHAFEAAREAVNCTLTAATELLNGRRLAYALVRPPGHHAERAAFGGFCYLNSTAVAAHYLSAKGTVAILDLDYHHGNGQQDIFYARDDVFTVSLHADPRFEYPHFSGYADERGEGRGHGYNVNYPLPLQQSGEQYVAVLKKAIGQIRRFNPRYLIVALGFDTAKGDPTGSWSLRRADFREVGVQLGLLRRPTLIVQEGGYRTRSLAMNAREFFDGIWHSSR